MNYDLSGLPEEVQAFIRTSIAGRRDALLTAEREIREALQGSINRIKERLGKSGVFHGVGKDLAKIIEDEKVFFATELDRIIQDELTQAGCAGLMIGEMTQKLYGSGLQKLRLIEKDILRNAELIAESTMQKKRIFKNKEFVLSDRIWDLSGKNYEKIKEILNSGINTDCVKVAKALECYVKKGAETFAKDYPAMYERMGGRVPKNAVYEALRLARNEASQVYWQATIEGYKDNPAIKAVKWLLSNNRLQGYHDICDELAYADNYGLGAGIYPVETAPEKPHICCLCCLAPVIAKDIELGDVANTPPENWDEIKERLKKTSAFTNMDELTEEQKEKIREKRRATYQRQKEKKATSEKELDKKLEALYDNRSEYRKVYAERYGSNINNNKQNRHIAGSKTLKENASYFENDIEMLQKIINEKAGSGEIRLTKRHLVEIITDDRLNGFDFSIIDKKLRKTCKGKIHYSKTGVHIVPFY